MKKLIICVLAFAAATNGFAGTKKDPNHVNRSLHTASYIHSLVVNGNTSVVLVNEVSKQISIEGSEDMINQVEVKEENGQLTITNTSKKGRTAAIVYVPAALISHIHMNGNGAVSTMETLDNKNIDVLVNGDCKLWIKTYGTVTVDAMPDFDYTYVSKKIKP
ncbi:MAG TPA: DUF2807 domain-containing protein [Ferruginibacter sp.]|nr:DUF2807 domain-containing protein [Ferruginibacter sp.]HMP19324.1 DUF2807 domain-containing protein [Ferruginibacter sp.]